MFERGLQLHCAAVQLHCAAVQLHCAAVQLGPFFDQVEPIEVLYLYFITAIK